MDQTEIDQNAGQNEINPRYTDESDVLLMLSNDNFSSSEFSGR